MHTHAPDTIERPSDVAFLARAAALARRGHGGAEPNPMVGCLIVGPGAEVVGAGHHRRCGGPHAEIHALRQAGARARGATAYVTLEPCNRTGRTGPCTEALIAAGIARVVAAQRDPHAQADRSAERLRRAGIEVVYEEGCREACAVSAPFLHYLETGRPWVIAKWAQTLDGALATAAGESRWISGERSRALVHRERGRVDAILTGIGTVLADDPMLTARRVRRRRVARRVVIDPALRIGLEAKLITSTGEAPTIVVCAEEHAAGARAALLRARGVDVLAAAAPADGTGLPLAPILSALAERYEVRTVLVESGPGLLGRLFRERLVNEVWAFIAPRLLGDEQAVPCVHGLDPATLAASLRLEPLGTHRRGEDILLRYTVPSTCPLRVRPLLAGP